MTMVALQERADMPAAVRPAGRWTVWVDRLLWLEACALLSIAHVLLGGYRLGVGNQSIQIPFLKWWINPALYPNDPVVATVRDYPSFFFRGLAWVVKAFGLAPTYLVAHFLTAFAVLAAVYWLGRAMFKDRLAGLIAIALLFAGHHHALGGDDLYSIGFTHTWAVFPLAIAVLALLYQGRHWMAFLLTGLLFNLHALTAAYLLAMLLTWALVEFRRIGFLKAVGLVVVFAAAAAPTVFLMIQHRQQFDANWVRLTYLRSADHSFPSSWWRVGDPDIPRFAVMVGLAALGMSFGGGNEEKAKRRGRITLALAAAVGAMFLVGYVCADVRPIKTVLRAQLFRSSRLLMVLMFLQIAYNAACAIRMARGEVAGVSRWRGMLELISAAVSVLCLAVPVLLPYLPVAFAAAVLVALFNGRLSLAQSICCGLVLMVAVVAWNRIRFVVPLPDHEMLHATWAGMSAMGIPFWIGLLSGLGLLAAARLSVEGKLRTMLMVQGALAAGLLSVMAYRPMAREDLQDDPWIDVQKWAKGTPVNTTFLVPSLPGGFRVYSERPVVCEWRDGTQMYFSAGFAAEWWKRLKTVRQDLIMDASEREILSYTPLESLEEEKIKRIAKETGASYIVLPARKQPRNLKEAYTNHVWTVYKPEPSWPAEAIDKEVWVEQDRFINEVCLPNIEKYRKGDVKLEVVDAAGKPISGLAYEAKLTRHHFGFGCSLPFFQDTGIGADGSEVMLPPVTEKELARFLEVFNYTVIPFSGKWMYIEPVEGQRQYEDIDKYINWCAKNGVEVEFHFLSGLWPAWMKTKSERQRSSLFLEHARDLVTRYSDRVKIWQVVNDRYLIDSAPKVMREIRDLQPEARLGISDCTKFMRMARGGGGGGPRGISAGPEMDIYRGLSDVKDLAQKGTPLDFYAPHAHAPHGLWPDVKQMYDTFDKFAEQNVRINVTEFHIPVGIEGSGYPISGPICKGRWTHELRADFFERYYTVCFSHPAVEVINYWSLGPDSVASGTGLLNRNYEPTAGFLRLKELIKEKWTTRVSGELSNGEAGFRGFYGEYDLAITLPSGKVVHGRMKIVPEGDNSFKVVVNEAVGTVVVE